jgi:putative serine protease PepD
VTSTWNDTPSIPPTTDADLCATWTPDDPHAHHSDQPTAPASPHAGEPTSGAANASPQFAAPTPPPPPPRISPSPSRGGGARVALVAVGMTALVGAGFVGRGLVDSDSTGTAPFTGRPIASAPANNQPSTPLLPGNDEEPVKAVAKALAPSVVVINVGQGLGSGVIYDASGLIVTNAHVVGDSTEVGVTLNDGRTLDGTVVGSDAPSDIAVVRVEPPSGGLAAARLAGQSPEVGDLVVALGSPFGLDQTITSGIISAVNRPVPTGNGLAENFLQTDAAINPGNSGGALANRKAEVVGINSQIYSESGGNQGIGFSIPIARAKSVADRLLAGQPVERAALGLRIGNTSDGTAGAKVGPVTPGSAAEQAGIKTGDVITAVNGTPVKNDLGLSGAIASFEPGETVKVTVMRDGQPTDLEVTLGTAQVAPTSPGRSQTPR